MVTLGINSSLRISDLLNLRIRDVIDENGKTRDRITLQEKKTNKTKDFPISDIARKAINEYLKARTFESEEPFFIKEEK